MFATIARAKHYAAAERYSATVADADLAEQLAQLVEGYWHYQARIDKLNGPAGMALPRRMRRRLLRSARYVAAANYSRAAVLSARLAKLC